MAKGKKKSKKHGFASDDEEEPVAGAEGGNNGQQEPDAEPAKPQHSKKGKKGKGKKSKDDVPAAPDDGVVAQAEDGGIDDTDQQQAGDDSLAESLIVAEVFEARSHPKFGPDQQLVTLFDGNDMYKVGSPSPCLLHAFSMPSPCWHGVSSAVARGTS